MTEVQIKLIILETNENNSKKYEEYCRLSPNKPV